MLAVTRRLVRRARRARTTARVRAHRALERRVLPAAVARRVRHLSGPRRVDYAPDELLVVCVVRDGVLHAPSFLRHHRDLGVAHVVVLDNGSTDGTLDVFAGQPDVTLLATDAPYRTYENAMKTYLARRFSTGRWNLCADVDERFDYPGSDRLGVAGLLGYLESTGATAMVAQMLDMLPEAPLQALRSDPGDDLEELYPWYDTSAVEVTDYPFGRLLDPAVRMHHGGVRRTLFGTRNGLTKAALVKLDGRLRPFVEWHHAEGAVVADVTAVLRHYPFVSTFAEKVAEAVRSGRYGYGTTDEYVAYQAGLSRGGDLHLRGPAARRLEGPEQLVDEGFLVAPERYRRWVGTHGAPTPAGPGA